MLSAALTERQKAECAQTVRREREVAQGVLPRESRKMDKVLQRANMYW